MATSLSLEELYDWSKKLAKKFSKKQILCLEGPLGAGKTKLVEQILNHLGVKEPVSSPTFSLINQYSSPIFPHIFHIDLYRIKDEEDLESTGFWDLFSQDEALILIEWSDRLQKEELPLDWEIETIKIEKPENQNQRTYYILGGPYA